PERRRPARSAHLRRQLGQHLRPAAAAAAMRIAMDLTRRSFLATAGGVAAATLAPMFGRPSAEASVDGMEMDVETRLSQAYRLRSDAAKAQHSRSMPAFPTNGDEERYPDRIGSYAKCLPHDDLGIVDAQAYDFYVKAVSGGRTADVEAIPIA